MRPTRIPAIGERHHSQHLGRTPLAILAASVFAVWTPPAMAQGLDLLSGKSDKPLEILADQGLEWQQKARAYIARGNASAKQGDVTVHARVLTAYYKETATGGSTVYRLDADDDVRIVSPTETVYGEKSIYDIENGVLLVTGKPRLVTQSDHISARDSLEYYPNREYLVARGEAVAVRGNQRLRADILTAHFTQGKARAKTLRRIEAYDNVQISTPTLIARGNRGVYFPQTGIAKLTGSVKITRGRNQLSGECAEVNLKTGVYRMLNCNSKRIRGYFVQANKRQASPGRTKNPSGRVR